MIVAVSSENQTFNHIKELIEQGIKVYDLASKGFFRNLKPYPSKPDFKDVVEICKCCGKGDVKLSAEEQVKEARDIYHKEENRLYRLFKEVLFFEYNIGPKKGNIVFQQAWEDGHASGYAEVVHYFEKYLDFVNEFNSVKED